MWNKFRCTSLNTGGQVEGNGRRLLQYGSIIWRLNQVNIWGMRCWEQSKGSDTQVCWYLGHWVVTSARSHPVFISISPDQISMMRNRIWKKKRFSNSSFHRYSRNQMRSCYNNAHAAQWVAACSCTWHLKPDSLISTMIKKLWNLISFFQNQHVYFHLQSQNLEEYLVGVTFIYCGHIYCER